MYLPQTDNSFQGKRDYLSLDLITVWK